MAELDLNTGAIAPVASEVTINDPPVTGQIPDDMDGTLFRNGPNPRSGRFEGDGMLSWWVGSAMLHSLSISEGRATRYSNSWASTEIPGQNPNVNVVHHNGQVLAMGEGVMPFVVDAAGTPTAPFDFTGAAPNGMTAHPKIDPTTGELIYFRADWQAPFLSYGVLDRKGQPTTSQVIEIDGPAMMHDMAVTATKSLILDLNVAYDFSLLQHGAPIPLRWHDDRQSRIGVIDRAGGDVTWVEIERCFIQHVVNAFDSEDRLGHPNTVVFDAVRYPDFLRFDSDAGAYAPNPLGVMWRYEINLTTGTVNERQLDDRNVELPRINEQLTGRPNRYAYAVEQPTDVEMRGLIKYDLEAGTAERHLTPAPDQNSEPIFVPRVGASSEDDGYVIACRYRSETHTTDVEIIDAADFSGEPLATVHLPVHIPAGFHGAWVSSF